jgi:hypothetical protein
MADPRAFLSFDYSHDLVSKNLFAGQAKSNSPTPFVVEDWSSKSTLPEEEWETDIEAKLKKCNMLIVLVGKSMSTALGVDKEFAIAKTNQVPTFGVYVDGAGAGSTLPVGLPRNRTISWTWPNVAAAVNQMMGEGKNIK